MANNTMTHNENKSPSCSSLELGCLIYGILNIVVTSVITLIGLGYLTYVGIGIHDLYTENKILQDNSTANELYLALVYLLFITGPAIVALLFAILLVLGVTKRSPCLVMTYFVFGLLVVILSVAGIVFYVFNEPNAIVAGVASVLILIYAAPLIVVIQTFKKFRAAAYRSIQIA